MDCFSFWCAVKVYCELWVAVACCLLLVSMDEIHQRKCIRIVQSILLMDCSMCVCRVYMRVWDNSPTHYRHFAKCTFGVYSLNKITTLNKRRVVDSLSNAIPFLYVAGYRSVESFSPENFPQFTLEEKNVRFLCSEAFNSSTFSTTPKHCEKCISSTSFIGGSIRFKIIISMLINHLFLLNFTTINKWLQCNAQKR